MLSKQRAAQLRAELREIQSKGTLDSHDVVRVGEIGRAIAGAIDDKARRNVLDDLGSPSDVAGVSPTPRSPGEAFVQSKEYRAIVESARTEGFPRFTTPEIEMKAPGGVRKGPGREVVPIDRRGRSSARAPLALAILRLDIVFSSSTVRISVDDQGHGLATIETTPRQEGTVAADARGSNLRSVEVDSAKPHSVWFELDH